MFILAFSRLNFMMGNAEFDPLAPRREAALFYGLFLRGHSADALRRDIDVPRDLLKKWMRGRQYEAPFRDNLKKLFFQDENMHIIE